jgi:flagellar biosynthetic protein FlhB
MAERDSDPTEQATPYKLQEARKRGSVARSTDFSAAVVLAALVAALYSQVGSMMPALVQLQRSALAKASGGQWHPDAAAAWLGQWLAAGLLVIAPVLGTLMIVAVAVNILQTGPILSFHPLKPDLDRLNPVAGFKRIASLRTAVEALKSVFKLVLLVFTAWILLRDILPGSIGLPDASPRVYLAVMGGLAGSLLSKLAAVLFMLGLADLLYVRWEYARQMRMSAREVREEHKNRNGDPRVRSRHRELRKELLKRSGSLRKVKSADVLITNPTHLAIALSYERGSGRAPHLIAKGAGDLALRMRQLARRHNVPVVENRVLARALFREVQDEGVVPEKWYPQVAKILVWVYAMRDMRRGSTRKLD